MGGAVTFSGSVGSGVVGAAVVGLTKRSMDEKRLRSLEVRHETQNTNDIRYLWSHRQMI